MLGKAAAYHRLATEDRFSFPARPGNSWVWTTPSDRCAPPPAP